MIELVFLGLIFRRKFKNREGKLIYFKFLLCVGRFLRDFIYVWVLFLFKKLGNRGIRE